MSENNGTTETKKTQTDVTKASDFVSKVIASCQDTWHLQCAQRLLSFFKETYFDRHGGKIAYDQLQSQLVDKIPMLIVLT